MQLLVDHIHYCWDLSSLHSTTYESEHCIRTPHDINHRFQQCIFVAAL